MRLDFNDSFHVFRMVNLLNNSSLEAQMNWVNVPHRVILLTINKTVLANNPLLIEYIAII